ncbi:MAG: hypothetical protein Q8N89_08380 [Azonexus sp.]|nr:hypothetical protein [Azonexus sp.]
MNKVAELFKNRPTNTARNPKPWVVIEHAGQDDENIQGDFATFKEAERALANWYFQDELESLGAKIMKRNNDGTLTTEY